MKATDKVGGRLLSNFGERSRSRTLRHKNLWRDPVGSSRPTGLAILADFSKCVYRGPAAES